MFFRAFFVAFFSYLSGRFHNGRKKKLVQLMLPHFQRLIRDVFLRFFFWGGGFPGILKQSHPSTGVCKKRSLARHIGTNC